MESESYYAVIFSSQRRHDEHDGAYAQTSQLMLDLAAKQAGYLGVESCRGEDGFGITVSYWQSLESIKQWKAQGDHLVAQKLGKQKWYSSYKLRICRIERETEFNGKS